MFRRINRGAKRSRRLTINDEEARQLSGEYSLVKAARKILSFGPDTSSLKGDTGLCCLTRRSVFAALPLEDVFDPTGQEILLQEVLLDIFVTKDYSFIT